MWSKKAKKIFFEILEDFSKLLLKIFEKTFSWQSLAVGLWSFLVQKTWLIRGWEHPKITRLAKKLIFFKVRDMDTLMQPRKKKYENDVTSALKMS